MMEPELLDSIAAADGGDVLLGDVVLAHGICASEAAEKGVSTETHASHLVVHGTLHLLGYDHETSDEDADELERVKHEALSAIDISDPSAVTEVAAHSNARRQQTPRPGERSEDRRVGNKFQHSFKPWWSPYT